MSTPVRMTTDALWRFDANPVLRGLDPTTFKLHVEFMHSHGSPRGEIITFAGPDAICASPGAIDRLRRD